MQWAFGWAPRFGLFEWEHTAASQVQTLSLLISWLEKAPAVERFLTVKRCM